MVWWALLGVAAIAGCGSQASTPSSRPSPTSTAPIPTLGQPWGLDGGSGQEGYGTVRPDTIFNGGDPTGQVFDLTWQSWGEATATGNGTGVYLPASDDPAVGVGSDSSSAPATVVAFNRGWCGSKFMYRAVEWFFPTKGESFDPNTYIDICKGDYVP
jgi:hypothetical protein